MPTRRALDLDELMNLQGLEQPTAGQTAVANVGRMGRELERRGTGPASRLSQEARQAAQTTPPAATGRTGAGFAGFSRGMPSVPPAQVEGGGAFSAAGRARQAIGDQFREWGFRRTDEPAQPAATTAQSASPAQPRGQANPPPRAPAQPERQTSFTNADAEGLEYRGMTVPGTDVPREPSPVQQMLQRALSQLEPERNQVRTIRHTPEERIPGSVMDQIQQNISRRQRATEEQGAAEVETVRQGQRQQARGQIASVLAELYGQEQALETELQAARAQATNATPQGRLALAKAAQIEEALTRLRAATATGETDPNQALALLFGTQDQQMPLEGLSGTVGTYSRSTGQPRLFDQEIRDAVQPRPRG